IREARHEVANMLPDVAGRENDALGIVVPEPEDRIGEIKRVLKIDIERGKIDRLVDANDRPVAWIHFGLGLPGIDHTRINRAPLVADLDRFDASRIRLSFLAECDDRMLDGDEVTLAEIAGGPVVARAAIVVGVQLDETVAPLAEQVER